MRMILGRGLGARALLGLCGGNLSIAGLPHSVSRPGFAIFLSLAAETLFRPNMIQEEGIINLLATGSKVGASRRLLQLLGLVRIFRRKIGPARGGPRRSRSRT